MAGFGKNPRHGKRPSSSSSSYFSTVSMVVLVAFCLLGVWMLTSSSSVAPPQSTTTRRHSRAAHPPPDLDIDEDEPKSESKLEETTAERNQQQDQAVNENGDEEKTGSLLSKQQQNDGETSAEQEAHDQQLPGEENHQQQQQQDDGETSAEQEAHDQQLPGEENQQQQQGEIDFDKQQDTNEESAEKTASQETQEQQPEQTNELENPREATELESQGEQTHEQTNDLENQGEHTHEQLENQGQTNEQQREQTNELESHQETQEKREHTNDSENQQESHEQREQTNNLENQLEQRNDLENPGESHEQLREQTNDSENQKEIQEHQEQQTNDLENPQETHEQQQEQTTNELDSQQETHEQQQQGTESNIDDVTQQQSQSETGENQDHAQQQIEVIQEGGNEDQLQSEQQTDMGGGNSEDHQQEIGNGNQQQGENKLMEPNAENLLPDAAAQSEVRNDSDGKKRAWATQADHSENEKERRKESDINLYGHEWELCNVTAGPDYIPCLDNEKAIKKLHIKHYEHRERHCPEESPTCLVPLPTGYKRSIEWPTSRDKIWYNNVPHTKLAEVKGHQNWVKVTGEFLTFPGGGTQFIHGALHYIDFLQKSVHDIAWGKHTRVVLDVGCGVASFGGYLFERDVLTMSFAPKDEHEAQVQFALERGIPAISAVMGSQRLQFPSRVFDVVHCARCRVPWHADGGTLLLELNRVLRPGGYFVWSATPVYQRLKEDVEIWKAMKSLTVSMCWDLITIKKDKLNGVGAAFFRKPVSNECYDNRKHHSPPMCKEDDDPNAAWYIPLKACMHRVPVDASERGSQWPEQWPRRVQVPPYWLNNSQIGVYGKAAPDDFSSDYEHWKRVVTKSYLTGFGIDWTKVRNVMDMRAVYGGFAAALKDKKVWVLNVVNIDSPDTLPIIYERGLFGIYHDWCESFSTYPRTYDLLHADHLFSRLKKRCKIVSVMAEVDRIMRPGGKLIVRDESRTVSEVENLLKSLHWDVNLTFSKDQEGILCAEKSDWRPEKFSDSS